MAFFIVTVKLPDAKRGEKISGACPLTQKACTDINGAHHSKAVEASGREQIEAIFAGFHITRIEAI